MIQGTVDKIPKQGMLEELITHILPYRMERVMDQESGEFYGRIIGQGERMFQTEKGTILHTCILWAYSTVYRLLGKEEYKEAVTRAKRYLIGHFYDPESGGAYWSLDYRGGSLDTKKQICAIGFVIYGLSEYYRATGGPEALEYAARLFYDIESHNFGRIKSGYCETLTREWSEIIDMHFNEKDANKRKTTDTRLYTLESYISLYRVWKDEGLKR